MFHDRNDRNTRFQHSRDDQVSPELKNVILSSTNIADLFVRRFFPALDAERAKLPEYLAPESAIVWVGNPLGGQDFVSMYASMPSYTKHEVTSYDVHPLPSPAPFPISIAIAEGRLPTPPSQQQQNAQQVVINVSGKVKIGEERGKNLLGFAGVFVVVQNPSENSKLIVKYMSYRYIYKPSDTTIAM